MNNFDTFLITSGINTDNGVFTPEQRFHQTVETINSIRQRAPESCIVFVDSQIVPLTYHQKLHIKSLVDHLIDQEPHIFEKVIFECYPDSSKSLGEYFLYDRALHYIKFHNLVGRRIFKISGRYRLKSSFDISAYRNPIFQGKYVFRNRIWIVGDWQTKQESRHYFLETRLWSMCGSLIDEFIDILPKLLAHSIKNPHGIELTLNEYLDRYKIFIVPQIHVEGHIATNGDYIED